MWKISIESFQSVGTMGEVCRLWNQHIAVNEPLRSQTCQAKFANCRCVCEPSNRICELPTRSLRIMTGVCEPKQVSRTSHEPKAVGTNFREWIYTILATIQTPFRLALTKRWPTICSFCFKSLPQPIQEYLEISSRIAFEKKPFRRAFTWFLNCGKSPPFE